MHYATPKHPSGTFGSVIAQSLLAGDKTHSRRILILERGPFVLPEHHQNMPYCNEPYLNRFDDELQIYTPGPALVPGVWYEFEINVVGDQYTVDLRNVSGGGPTMTTTFTNTDGQRGIGEKNGEPIGHIGIQSYPNSPLSFHHIQIKTL